MKVRKTNEITLKIKYTCDEVSVNRILKYVKNYLRIDNDCDDELLINAIATAINYAEYTINKVFGSN